MKREEIESRLTWVAGGVVHSKSIFLQHVQESGLACIVKTQEENFCILLIQPCQGHEISLQEGSTGFVFKEKCKRYLHKTAGTILT